ncbi:MAG: hypothetical protein V4614_03635 [Pseudomonadota bacterium]
MAPKDRAHLVKELPVLDMLNARVNRVQFAGRKFAWLTWKLQEFIEFFEQVVFPVRRAPFLEGASIHLRAGQPKLQLIYATRRI